MSLGARKKRFRLRKISLGEVSLVDLGADPNATIAFFKRRESRDAGEHGGNPPRSTGANSMTDLEKMMADMSAATTTITDLQKRLDESAAKIEAAEQRAAAAEAKASAIAKAAGSGKTDAELEDDDILKSADPQVAAEIIKLRKANAASARRLAEMEEAGEIAKAVRQVAADYKHLPIKAETFGPVIKRASSSMDDEDFAELTRVLKAADAAMHEATATLGYTGILAKSGAEEAMDVEAKKIATAEGVTLAKAHTLVLERNPDLYRQFLAERGEVN